MSFNSQVFYDNNPNGIYYAGQVLSGRVEVTLTKVKKIRSLYLTINGKAQTSWNESETYRMNGKTHTRTVNYSAEEIYLNSVTYLVGAQQGPELTLQPGKHTYTFMCALPALLPCSYEGSYGYVRYTAKVTLDRPWKFDQTSKAAFTVIAPLDLRYDPRYRIPVSSESSKTFWCGCTSGPLTVKAQIPMTGYAPGQEIVISCDVSNDSRIDVENLEFKIRKTAKYHSRTPQHKVRTNAVDLVTLRADGVPRFTKKSVVKSLQLPVIPPSLLHNCSIIDIDYQIRIKAQISGCHRSLRLELPLTVGTVPIEMSNQNQIQNPIQNPMQNSMQNSMQNPIGFSVPSAPPITLQPDGTNQPNYDDLPPSYEQCMFGTQSIHDSGDSQHTLGFQNFTPSYPVYHAQKH